jgi:hypothetical protein
MLGPELPRWMVSRWLVALSHDCLGRRRDRQRRRALEIALGVRGGRDGSPTGGDAQAHPDRTDHDLLDHDFLDHDWVYRHVATYELGGLARFVRLRAAPELVTRADRIHEWARAPMAGLRLVERACAITTWERLDTGERLELANVGSAALVADGEHVLGRLVPVEEGLMLEGAPVVVPRAVAEQVAADPSSWIEAIRGARGEIHTDGFELGLGHDVRRRVWELTLLDLYGPVPRASKIGSHLARRALIVARECLAGQTPTGPDRVDLWACLRAAFLDRRVVSSLPAVVGPDDVELLERLSGAFASPADVVCRDLLALARAAA